MDLIGSVRRSRNMVLAGYGATILLYLGAFICMLKSMKMSMLVVGLVTVFYFIVVQSGIKEWYNRNFARANLLCSAPEEVNICSVKKKGKSETIKFFGKEMLPIDTSGISCGLELIGTWKNSPCSVSEFTSYYKIQESKHKIGIIDGLWMEIRQKMLVNDQWIFMNGNVFPEDLYTEFLDEQGLKPVMQMKGSEGMQTLFGCCADQKKNTFLIKRCRKLTAAMKTPFVLMISEQAVCLYLPGHYLKKDIPIRGSLEKDIICHNQVPEWSAFLNFVQELQEGCTAAFH